MGNPEDFTNFINAVIDERAFDKISGYIANAKKDKNAEIIAGGKYDKSEGYFIEPTVILVKDANYRTMCEEIFGPVLTIFVYKDEDFDKTLDILDQTSPYALTGVGPAPVASFSASGQLDRTARTSISALSST